MEAENFEVGESFALVSSLKHCMLVVCHPRHHIWQERKIFIYLNFPLRNETKKLQGFSYGIGVAAMQMALWSCVLDFF